MSRLDHWIRAPAFLRSSSSEPTTPGMAKPPHPFHQPKASTPSPHARRRTDEAVSPTSTPTIPTTSRWRCTQTTPHDRPSRVLANQLTRRTDEAVRHLLLRHHAHAVLPAHRHGRQPVAVGGLERVLDLVQPALCVGGLSWCGVWAVLGGQGCLIDTTGRRPPSIPRARALARGNRMSRSNRMTLHNTSRRPFIPLPVGPADSKWNASPPPSNPSSPPGLQVPSVLTYLRREDGDVVVVLRVAARHGFVVPG